MGLSENGYGEAKYLNDIYVGIFRSPAVFTTTLPEPVVIELPERFRGRGNDVEIFLSMAGFNAIIGTLTSSGSVINLSESLWATLAVVSKDFDLTKPKIEVDAYIEMPYYSTTKGTGRDYITFDFMLLAIGK